MKFANRLPALLVAALIALAPGAVFMAPADAYAQATPPAAEQPAAAAPAPAKTPATRGGAGQREKETIEDPYGLEAIWKTGDFVTKGTFIILIIMAVGSWYIMFVKVYEQMKLFRQAKDVQAKFWQAGSVQEGVASLKEGSPFRYIAESGIKASSHHEGKLLEQIDLNTWVTMSIQRAVDNVSSRLQDGLAFLAT